MQVPGLQVMAIELAVPVPVHCCGPLRVITPVLLTLPLKALNGESKVRAQFASLTDRTIPTKVASQCSVTFQLPPMFGQVSAGFCPPPPAASCELPAVPLGVLSVVEFELQAPSRRSVTRSVLIVDGSDWVD